MQNSKLSTLLALSIAGIVLATPAFADALPDTQFNGLLQLIENSSKAWHPLLLGYAVKLFWILAGIQLVWTLFPMVIRQADLSEIAGELLRFVLTIGFFYLLLTKSSEWGKAVVDSFRQAGAHASGLDGTVLHPGDLFATGVQLAKTILNVTTINPLTAVSVTLAGLLVLLCFAFIAAFLALTIIESYIVINAAVLFMGFGGSQWTRDYAMAMPRYAVAVGAKLFVLTLLVGLVTTSATKWQAAYNNTDDASMWTMVGLAFTCAYLTRTVPELVSGMISGTSMGGGSAIGSMAAIAATAAAAVATGGIGAVAGALGSAGGAAGAAGAAGAGASAGGSGLAASIQSSLAGGSGTLGGKAAMREFAGLGQGFMNSAPTTAPSAGASGLSGTAKVARAASGSENTKKGDAVQAGRAGSGSARTTSQPSGQAFGPTGGSSGGSASVARGAHQMAEGAVRTVGAMAAVAVPGAEGAAGLSLGEPLSVPGIAEDEPSMAADTDVPNVIRPAGSGELPGEGAAESTGRKHDIHSIIIPGMAAYPAYAAAQAAKAKAAGTRNDSTDPDKPLSGA